LRRGTASHVVDVVVDVVVVVVVDVAVDVAWLRQVRGVVAC